MEPTKHAAPVCRSSKAAPRADAANATAATRRVERLNCIYRTVSKVGQVSLRSAPTLVEVELCKTVKNTSALVL